MYNESIVTIGTKPYKVFFKSPIGDFRNHTSPLHHHHYTEIHLLARGNVTFDIDGKPYELKAGSVLAVPQQQFHLCTRVSDDTYCLSFFMDAALETPQHLSSSAEMIETCIHEYKRSLISQNYCKMSAYIALLCADFLGDEILSVKESNDYAIMIEEFFTRHYTEEIHLSDLAETLHLSKKQTERLVLKHSGQTFKQKLSDTRITIAQKLIRESQMPMQKAAEYVGYTSYSGFWKAMQKHK